MKNNLKKNIYTHVELNHCAVRQKLTRHCKPNVLQFQKTLASAWSSSAPEGCLFIHIMNFLGPFWWVLGGRSRAAAPVGRTRW